MLTDSTTSELHFDLTCTEETVSDENDSLLSDYDKENHPPHFLSDDLDASEDKENMPLFEPIDHLMMPPLRAGRDSKLLEDSRVLQNLLLTEDNFTSYPSTYKFQDDLKPHMRRTVAQWMMDVCDDQERDEECFSLSMNYLDRVLSCHKTDRSKLQLIATACLYIASKVKESTPFSPRKLVAYTEHSISIQDLLEWEVLVLQILKWDTCPIIAHDYLPYLVAMVTEEDIHDHVINHAQTFISLCSAEFEFSLQPASVLACASVCIAVGGLSRRGGRSLQELYVAMNDVTSIDVECIKTCQEQIDRLLSQHISMTTSNNMTTTNMETTNSSICPSVDEGISVSFSSSSSSSSSSWETSSSLSSSSSLTLNTNLPLPLSLLSPSTTPTDVKDIMV